jgi:hypothetical protein
MYAKCSIYVKEEEVEKLKREKARERTQRIDVYEKEIESIYVRLILENNGAIGRKDM